MKRVLSLAISIVMATGLLVPSSAHDEKGKKLPPSKAAADLKLARTQMDTAKRKLAEKGSYSCCIKPPAGAKEPGCDLCAKNNGSCNCGSNLAAGKGVCGECLAGWRTGKGTFPKTKSVDVTLLDSSHQAIPGVAQTIDEVVAAQATLIKAKKVLVSEKRYSCCIKKGGCDSCAYEANCNCAGEIAKGPKGSGICGDCLDGQHAGIGRIAGIDLNTIKLEAMHGDMIMAFAGIPENREGSGTSWQPDATPMHGSHTDFGRWMVMTHYNVSLNLDRQTGARGGDQFNSTNWFMLMGQRALGKGDLQLKGMFSLDPLTVGPGGYPLLFQSGEVYGGKALVDKQHPHDLFMELAARYRYPLSDKLAVSLYGGPVGEPALGPVAYPHRASAGVLPMAPISHHWQDSSHISSGVITNGVSYGNLQLEHSIFIGREPDAHRWNIDPIRLDSSSSRLSWNPNVNWSLQASYGELQSPEALHPFDNLRRTTASAQYYRPNASGYLASSLVWGRNDSGGVKSDSILLEGTYAPSNKWSGTIRLETVDKLGDDLNVLPTNSKNRLTELTLGAIRELAFDKPYSLGIGGAITWNWKPTSLDGAYGKNPMGLWLFVRLKNH